MQPQAQATTSADALSQLQSAEQSAQDPNSILQAQNQQFGVNSQQQTVQGLQGALNNTTKLLQQVAPSVMGRTADSLVTNAQASKQIQNEQAPISTNLSNEGTQYNQANQLLSTDEQQAQTAANGIYTGQQDKLSYLQNIYNNLFTSEQDAQAEQDKQAALAEQAREANLEFPSGSGSGSTSTGPLSGGKTSAQAQTDVGNVLKSGIPNFLNWYSAVSQSASNGNTYDQAKLQLLEAAAPGLFANGQLNTGRINYLQSQGLGLI